MTIRFLKALTLSLEQKTDSNETTARRFKAGEVVTVEGVLVSVSSPDWYDIVFPRESGWIAAGVHKSAFEVV